jgi:hypothetical protein
MRTRWFVVFGWLAWLTTPQTLEGGNAPRFAAADNREAWELLPPTAVGQRVEALPIWARILVRPLPSATAAMLEMDYLQRMENPLPPCWRAKIRWIAARTNGSLYAEACARDDLLRAGGNVVELDLIETAPEQLSDKERRVFAFARRMCQAAYEVTDADVEELLRDWGSADLTAIVLTLAYANFQDRIFQALGIQVAEGERLSALNVRFDWDAFREKGPSASAREAPSPPFDAAHVPARVADERWSAPLEDLERQLSQTRAPRVPIPPADVVERQTPPGIFPPGRTASIKWNCITYGYQPRLTHAWFLTMQRFREESALPDDFRQSVFWVVTRSNWCFY